MCENNTHIGFIAPQLYPNKIGGMEIFNYFLIKELSKSCQITVYTTKKVILPPKIKVVVVSPKLFGNSGFTLGQIWFGLKVIVHLCQSSKNIPDIIHIPFTSNAKHYGLVYPAFLKILKIPYIISIHGGGLKPWKPKWIYSHFFKHAAIIVAASTVIKKEYEKRTKRDIMVILPLIPFSYSGKTKNELRVMHEIEREKFVILFLGTLKEIKRPLDIILAINYLGLVFLRKHNILLLFVGEGNQRKELEEEVLKYNLTPHVRFIGQVHFEDTPKYYESSDLFIISSRFEGTSKSLVGAMFYGVPIIGSDVKGINNIIKNGVNGLLYPLCDVKHLANCIKKMVCDNYIRNNFSLESKRTYDINYSFEIIVDEFMDAYRCSTKKT